MMIMYINNIFLYFFRILFTFYIHIQSSLPTPITRGDSELSEISSDFSVSIFSSLLASNPYLLIFFLLPIAFLTTAYYALKYHYEFNKLNTSVNSAKDMIGKIIEEQKSEEKLDTSLTDLTLFMDKIKKESEIKAKDYENRLELYKNIFENTGMGIALITERNGNFVIYNNEFKRITGCGEKQLEDNNILSILTDYNTQNFEVDNMTDLLQKREFLMYGKKGDIISVKLLYTSMEHKGEELLTILLDNVTETISLKENIDRQNKKLSIINEIAREVNQSLDLQEILQDTLDKVLEITDTEGGFIMLMDENKKKLKPVAFSGITEKLIQDIKKTYIKSDTGTRGRALSKNKAVSAKHIPPETSLTGILSKKGSLKSIAMVPLNSKNGIIGLMQVGSYREGRFSEEELNLLDVLGNYIGIAVSNANLYETIKKQLEQLERKNVMLTELETMKRSLIQMIVHDLKNPLMGIMGYTDLLMDEEEKFTNSQINSLKMIYISSKNLMRMILNLLDMSRMEEQRVTLKLEEVNLKDLITKNIYEIRPLLLKENKKIETKLPEILPIIKVDKDLINRVIANLLNNAVKYSPPRGNVTIGANYGETKNWLTLYIKDEGKGIPKDFQERIFEKFTQLEARENKYQNLRTSRGLGLTFCKLAVESHGGRIWVESDIGRGSKFCFNLPIIYFPDEKEFE